MEKSAKENYQLEDFYVLRAVAAHTGLYGNSGTEATYPTYLSDSEGNSPNTGDNKYTITFQKDSPGKALEANWLPAPDGPMYTVLRLYGPEEVALKGEWVNPPLVKVSKK